jgi:hypothetical protein
MSSLLRRIEKRIMKKAGMKKITATVPASRMAGGIEVPYEKKVTLVYDADEDFGSKWPRAIPRKYVAPCRQPIGAQKLRPPRGNRRKTKLGKNHHQFQTQADMAAIRKLCSVGISLTD